MDAACRYVAGEYPGLTWAALHETIVELKDEARANATTIEREIADIELVSAMFARVKQETGRSRNPQGCACPPCRSQ